MKFKEFVNFDFFYELGKEYLGAEKAICTKCKSDSGFFIEPGNYLRCIRCDETFPSKEV